jgi:hypothetical protein
MEPAAHGEEVTVVEIHPRGANRTFMLLLERMCNTICAWFWKRAKSSIIDTVLSAN